MNIVIDIGHANGTGARGNGYEEHALCAIVGDRIKAAIEKHGHKVHLIDFPEQTNKEDLRRTINKANSLKQISFGISLHMDASTNSKAKGGHACYVSEKGKILAESIASPLCETMPGRAVQVVKRTDLAMLNQTRAAWTLLELGFITSKEDIKKLVDDPSTAKDELKPLLTALEKGILACIERAAAWNTRTA